MHYDARPIRNEEDYLSALTRLEEIFDAKHGTSEGSELNVLSKSVELYESSREFTLRQMAAKQVANAQVDGAGNITIQNVDGSTVVVNVNDTGEVRRLIIDLGDRINQLPHDVIEMLNNKQDNTVVPTAGANIYLGIFLHADGYGQTTGFSFGVTITNLNREHRYFNQPFFKKNPPFEALPNFKHDTFQLRDEITHTNFPARLEYGQPVSLSYPISDWLRDQLAKIVSEDVEAYIGVYTSTTVGEVYKSNLYRLNKFVDTVKNQQ